MPSGGSDHCGNCRHNRINFGRTATRDEKSGPAFCTIRGVEVRSSYYTYCANHYKDLRSPLGPMYASLDDHERIPYHGAARPKHADVARCHVCGGPSPGQRRGAAIEDPAQGRLEFCGAAHYTRWWKGAHPRESLLWDCDVPPLSAGQARERDVLAMLELARAYVAAGDLEGAREVLEEAGRSAAGAQREEALALLASIAKP